MSKDETNREYDPARKRSTDCSQPQAHPDDDEVQIIDECGGGYNYDDEHIPAPIEVRPLETTETPGGRLVISTDLDDDDAPVIVGESIDLGRVC